MIVYRLEKKGIGPFIGRSTFYGAKNPKRLKRSNHIQHQINFRAKSRWTEHYRAVKEGKYLFGASSKDMLKAYFSYNLQPYFKQGYRIRTYKVPDYCVIDMGSEVAFPVRFHKLKTVDSVKERIALTKAY